jgi:hypothetical protein
MWPVKKLFFLILPLILCATFLVTFSVGLSAHAAERPYYGFYSSSLGLKYKRFEHNILGFSIDIPSTWIFGVNGSGTTTVAIFYPEDFDTSKLTNSYETIEIGILPMTGISLSKAYSYIILGMNERHQNLITEEEVAKSKIGKFNSLKFLLSWKSKNGSTIKEWIHLIRYNDQIRSLTVRVGQNKWQTRRDFYYKFVQSYIPLDLGF